jgi:hypothetical protein
MSKPKRTTIPAAPTENAFGIAIASDGMPVFADGLSRRQWLAEHADERKQAIIAELRAPIEGHELGELAEPEGHG